MAPIDRAAADSVLDWLDALDRPLSLPALVQEIGRCLMLTKSRPRDADDQALMLGALADELAAFPGDVVATELRAWARRETWWPTLAEIAERCRRATRARNGLRRACESGRAEA